jgi:hypothetical protein
MCLPSEGEHADSPLHGTTVELLKLDLSAMLRNQKCARKVT